MLNDWFSFRRMYHDEGFKSSENIAILREEIPNEPAIDVESLFENLFASWAKSSG